MCHLHPDFPMRALFFRSVLPVLGLSFVVLMMACNMGNSPIPTSASFSLEYRVHKGLDCFMVQDCGYKIELAQTGALARYEDTGAESLAVSTERQLSQEQMNALHEILDETGFFNFPALLPTEDPRAGAGSVSVTYVAWPSKTSKFVEIMKGSPLPPEVWQFINRMDSFFVDVLE